MRKKGRRERWREEEGGEREDRKGEGEDRKGRERMEREREGGTQKDD